MISEVISESPPIVNSEFITLLLRVFFFQLTFFYILFMQGSASNKTQEFKGLIALSGQLDEDAD